MLSTADQDWKILCKPVKGLHIRLIVEEDYKLLIFHYVTPPPPPPPSAVTEALHEARRCLTGKSVKPS